MGLHKMGKHLKIWWGWTPPSSPPTLSVYTLVYSFQEILILSEGVPVYGHLVEHIACIQQGHARRDTIASVLSFTPCELITTDLLATLFPSTEYRNVYFQTKLGDFFTRDIYTSSLVIWAQNCFKNWHELDQVKRNEVRCCEKGVLWGEILTVWRRSF